MTIWQKMKYLLFRPTIMEWLGGIVLFVISISFQLIGDSGNSFTRISSAFLNGLLLPFVLSAFAGKPIKKNRSFQIVNLALAFFFSQCLTIGNSFIHVEDWSLCFGSATHIIIWIVQSLGYTFVLYLILIRGLSWMENYAIKNTCNTISIKKWGIIFVSIRLLFFVAFYPCVFNFDSAVGMHTFLSSESITCNHHPYFLQLLHSAFFLFGKSIGHKSVGMAILSLITILLTSAILIYGLLVLRKAKISKQWMVAIAAVFAFFPLFPYLSVCPTKDGLFAYSFLFYLFSLYELYLSKGECVQNYKFLLLHSLSILLVGLTRHQGIIIILLNVPILLVCYRKYWSKILLLETPAILLLLLYSKVLLPMLMVEPGGKQEIYGTLFQQTANYLKHNPTDITTSEKQAIQTLLGTSDLGRKYTFDGSDAVKNDYKYNPWYRKTPASPSLFRHIDKTNEPKELADYRKAWISMGLRHPLPYLEATTAIFLGFFSNYNLLLVESEPNWAENRNAAPVDYTFFHIKKFAFYYDRHAYNWLDKPILGFFLAICYYNWAALIMLTLLIYRRDLDGLSIFFPVLISIGVLAVCPAIYGRYAYPIAVSLPLLFLYLLKHKANKRCQE